MKCPICNYSDNLALEDVNPSQQLKFYSDSIYASIKKTTNKEKDEVTTVKDMSSFKKNQPFKRNTQTLF